MLLDVLMSKGWFSLIFSFRVRLIRDTEAYLLRRSIIWKMFVNVFFNEKYLSQSVVNQMERQFLDQIQGSKTVANYNDRFNALS